jgi:hypothetical protein
MAKDEEQRLLTEINRLAQRLQEQRSRKVADPDAQERAVRKLEVDLSACWNRLRAERAKPAAWMS